MTDFYTCLDGNLISEENYKSYKERLLTGVIRQLKEVSSFISIFTNDNVDNLSKEDFIERLEELATEVGGLDSYTIDLIHLVTINNKDN